MDVPISLGITLATAMSLFQTMRGTEQVYFDAAISLTFFLLIGRYLDEKVRVRARGAAENLLGLKALAADVVGEDGEVRRLSRARSLPGMRVQVAAGERIPVDGRVLHGDDRHRYEPDHGRERAAPGVRMGDGARRHGQPDRAPIIVEATATDDNTLLADIARLVAAAEQGRGALRPARRSRGAALRAGGAHPRCGDACWLAAAGRRLRAGAHLRHRRAHHHMPVRAGAGGSRRAGGGDRPAVREGCHRESGRRPGTAVGGRHDRVRQDRHADAGRAIARECGRDRRCDTRGSGFARRRQPASLFEGRGANRARARYCRGRCCGRRRAARAADCWRLACAASDASVRRVG